MAFNSESYVKMFTDMMSEGFIVIDNKGSIRIYNEKAKEIFGITQEGQKHHEEGKLESGDIIIIGDNSIGKDDGKIDSETLKFLGIKDNTIGKGDSLIVVGVFNENGIIEPVFKTLKSNHKESSLVLNTEYLEIPMEIKIDFANKLISIKVRDEEFIMNYINAIGHMVILDGTTKEMKFYQSHGYTAREESINDLLKGKVYRPKGKNTETLDVIGKNIFQIHKSDSIIEEFFNVAKGEDISYIDRFEDINGYPTMCTLLPVEDKNNRIGAALKVEDISEIKRIIKERDNAINKLEKAEIQLNEEKILNIAFSDFRGDSKEIETVKRMALKASKTNSNVLLLGESGTGKTILAKHIHENSKLKSKRFIHVNCGSIPETLLESELFGYEKGAFTGALSEGKKGFFEIANGGTIFLDEIGDIPMNLQVKLLQIIQEKWLYRVGGTEKIEVNIRIIAATNKNLEEEMLKGNFREDLYYRINVFPIWIPPLRERKEDIIPLIDTLLPKICREIGCEPKRISSEAINILVKYNWPGNIRELENILERAVNLAEGNNILSKHIKLGSNKQENKDESIKSLKDSLEEYEKKLIEEILSIYKGNKKRTMEALKISKTTFYEKIKKYNIE
ncbi:sigma 54-interacting transcriptional regulator [Tissierella pigra]|uniref:AAA domain-containing protein n=1 Tax=Tissierella pigra TaxID=2607614 RepID=A0A6N7XYE5_9FIRM|nr:sigma 54-interacting transcriptional regulator [Tissierella pigra]MBU5425230.1 sigma 54-interacting transcriptional regulator [Tissierella pigra]MSU02837.1 AAA domain-containing protein [Tissierella pigra]